MILEFLSILPWKVWVALIGIAAVFFAAIYIHDSGYSDGASGAKQEITDANRASEGRADAAGSRVDRCYGTGGTWDRAHGVCDYPAGR